ncbi:Ig-like domain-containing protein [Pseudomonas sp. nanlin1]|uniref:Ig-like domain-containing protein n=1 Tax=Pseudomonas sp. nanlin1 TaxID=3040605 RepID=UPI00388DCCA3
MKRQRTHSSSIRLALENRLMFDGAAVATVEAAVSAPAAAAAPATEVAEQHDAVHASDTPAAVDTSHHSSDPAATGDTDALEYALTATAPLDAGHTRQEIYFVDSSLPDLDTLVSSLPSTAEVIYLDSQADGLAQISSALQGRSDIDAIHLLTHATEGSLLVGGTELTASNIEGQYHDLLAEIGTHMSSGGDVLLYGCNLAAGTEGAATMMALAQALNTDVAGSTNTTGVGGDWTLESHVGTIEASAVQASQWQHDLLVAAPTNDTAVVYHGAPNVLRVLDNDLVVLGATVKISSVTGQSHGTVVINADNTLTYTPTAGYAGTDTFSYTLKDGLGLVLGSAQVTVMVDSPPVVRVPGPISGIEDTALILGGSNAITISDSDQTATTVTLSVPSGGVSLSTLAGLTFTAGDGVNDGLMTFSGSIVAVNTALNGLVYTPGADVNGAVKLTVIATDALNGSATSSVTMNLAAVADIVADTVTMPQNTTASFNVLANDNFESAGRTVTGYSAPAHGTVSIDAQGNALYTPTSGYSGSDTFTYTVTSGGVTETASVTVNTYINYAPTISAPVTQTFAEDSTRVFSSAQGNAITLADANNDLLSVTLSATHGSLTLAQTSGLTFTSGDGVADTSMVVRGTAAAINAALNGLAFIPVADYNGSAVISVQASDGIAAVQNAMIAMSITAVADGVADNVQTGPLAPVTFAPLANDNFEGTPSISAVGSAAHGTVQLLGNNITYSPALGYIGSDTFTYTVSSGGASEVVAVNVTVGNSAPTASSLGTLTTVDGGLVLVTAALAFRDADALDVLTYKATGLPAGLTIDPLTGIISGLVNTHASVNGAAGTGNYTAVVTATDLSGASVTSTLQVQVSNPAPIPLIGLQVGGSEDSLLGISASTIGILDLDGDAFSITQATALNGTVTINADGSLSYLPNANYNGLDTITYTVRDVDGGVATGNILVVLAAVPDLPVLNLPNIPLLTEDTPLIFANLLGQQLSVGDIDGQVLDLKLSVPVGSFTLTQTAGLSISQGTGSNDSTLQISGTVADINAALRGLIYTPDADYNGPVAINLDLGQLMGGILNVHLTLPVGIAAVADIVDDHVSTTLNTPASFNVLANDSFENSGRVVSAFSTPAHGSVTLDAQGNALYTPNTGYVGNDSFTYTVTSNGTQETATVYLSTALPNYAPSIAAPTSQALAEDSTLVFSSAQGNAIVVADANGDTLTVTLQSTHGSLTLTQTAGLTFVSGDGSADASMVVRGSATAINAALEGMSFTPSTDYNGSASLSVLASDGVLSQASSIALNITPVADGVSDNLQTGPLAPLTFNPLANDTFEATPAIVGVSQGSHGVVVLDASGLVTYTPALGFKGNDSFTYTVSSGGVTEQVSVNVSVGNTAPLVNGNLGSLALLDAQLVIGVPTAQAFSDADRLDVLHYSANGLPTGLTIDPLSGLISGQVNGHSSVNGAAGAYNVTVTATDLSGASASTTLLIQVSNPAPIPAVGVTVQGVEDTPLTIGVTTLAVIDPDGDGVTLTTASAQHGSVTINSDGSLAYTPNANYNGLDTITYTVRDSDGGSATGQIAVVIAAVLDLPTLTLPTLQILAEDTPLLFANLLGQQLSVGDVDGQVLDLRISVPVGTLSLTQTAGIDLREGTGNHDTSVRISGTLAAINAALNGVFYTPGADYNGPVQVTLQLGQLAGGILNVSAELPITITPVADIVADHVSTVADTQVSFNVLANDSFENSGRVVQGFSTPSHGSVTIDAQGNALYTPAMGFTGTDTFTYTVLSNGTLETATVTVAINAAANADPIASPILNQTAVDGQAVNLAVGSAFRDPDGDTLSFSANGLPAGLSIDSQTGAITGTLGGHASTLVPSGAYTIVVSASDGKGGLLSQSFTLTVSNPAPLAFADAVSGNENSVLTGNVLSNDRDPDGDTLRVDTQPVSGPSHGTLVLNADGSFVYTPTLGYNGSDSFEYRVIDSDGGSAVATVTLTLLPVNDAPTTAGSLGAQSAVDSAPFSLNVAGQFSDVDGDTLSYSASGLPTGLSIDANGVISGVLGSSASTGGLNGSGQYIVTVSASDGHGGTAAQTFVLTVTNPAPSSSAINLTLNEDTPISGTLSATDVDGDSLTFSTQQGPAHGTLVLNGDGSYTYTPEANYHGADSFSYRVVDADGGVATAVVSLTIAAVNDAPTALGSVPAQSANDSAPFSLNLASAFTDVDGDTLSYSASGLPAGLSIDANGLISGTLGSSASADGLNGGGQYNVTVSARDADGATVQQSFVLIVSNPAPSSANSALSTAEDTPLAGNLLASDVDGDRLTFTASIGPSHGTLVLNADGSYLYTPDANFNGSDSFTYQVTDADGATVSATVSLSVTPVNDAPVALGSVAAQTGVDSSPFNLALAGRFADVDGDTLFYSASGLPSGLSIGADGTISGIVGSSASAGGPNGDGQYTVVVSARDGQGAVVTQSFTLSVSNPLPTATGSTVTLAEDSSVSGNLLDTASDLDGDTLRVDTTPVSAPLHGVLTLNADGSYRYTPAHDFHGTDSFTYRVIDADGGTSSATINLIITPVDDAPVSYGSIASQASRDGAAFSLDVGGNFADVDSNPLNYSASGLPNGLSIDLHTGLISGTLDSSASTQGPGQNGLYTIVVTASDGSASATQTFTLNVSNPAPVANSSLVTLDEDSTVSGNLMTTATDVDGDTLTFTATTQPANGTLVLNPNGSYTYTPNANFNGTDSFTYSVTDADGAVATATITFNVSPVYDAPVTTGSIAAVSANDSTAINLNVAGNFTDVDGTTLTYSATGLPNGISINPTTGLISGDLGSSASSAVAGGIYNVIVTASDGLGGTVSQSFTLTATNPAPTAGNTTVTLAEDTPVTGNLVTSATDVDGDALTFAATSQPSNGTLVLNPNGSYTYTPNTNFNGTDSFSYSVTDADGAVTTATITFDVTPVYDAPVAAGSIAAISANDGTSVSLNVSGNFADVDGTALTYSATGLPNGISINPTTGLISGDLGSSASSAVAGGIYNVIVTASDGLGGTVSQSFTLTATNPAPTAGNTTVTLAEDTPVSGNLVTTATDVDGDTLTFTATTQPANGTLVLNPNGNYTYTPNANFNGTDSFSYSVTDADGAVTTATITFNVSPVYDAPVATGSIAAVSANDSTAINLNVAGNFADVDGTALTYSATGLPNGISINPTTGLISGDLGSSASSAVAGGIYNVIVTASDGFGGTVSQSFTLTATNPAPTAGNTTVTLAEDTPVNGNLLTSATDVDGDALTFAATSQPSNGTLVLNPNGSYTYTPNTNFNGTDSFSYSVTDADGAVTTATITFDVTPVYDAPVAAGSIAAISANDGTSVSLNVSGNFADVDGTALTYSATGLPNGISINPTTGLISGDLGSSASSAVAGGIYNVIVTASDGLGGTVSQSFTLTATNPAPTAGNTTVTLAEDTPVSGNLVTTATDVDGDTLTFTATTQPANGTLVLNPNGSYTFTPNANFNGTDSFTYSVTDADGAVATATITFDVTAVYDAPVAAGPIAAISANDGTSVSLNVSGNFADVDGTALTYSATGLPNGISINPTTGLISGDLGSSASSAVAGGIYNVIVTASDGLGGTVSQTFTLTATNPAPTASNTSVSLAEDTVVTGNLVTTATDVDGDALTFTATTQPANGTLVLNPNGSYTYTPNANFNGTDSFSYSVTDADGAVTTATITFNVSPIYDAPVATGSIAAVSANDSTAINLNVAGNFADVDGTALTYSATGLPNGISINPTTGLISGNLSSSASSAVPGGIYTVIVTVNDGLGGTVSQTFTLTATNPAPTASNTTVTLAEDTPVTGNLVTTATDVDGDALTFAATTQPTNGTLVLNPNGSYTYTPNANFNGTDSFSYSVTDADGAVTTATITFDVTPVYDAPVATGSIAAISANDSTSVSLNIAGNFADVDGTTLTYSATGLPNGISINPLTGLISGTLGSSASAAVPGGVYTVVVTASDGAGGIASQSFTLTAENPAPVASDRSLTVLQGSTYSGVLQADDSDGDALSYAVTQLPAHGSLTLNADGSYSYTPAPGFTGQDGFSYQIIDADGGTAIASVTFTVSASGDQTPVLATPIAAQQAVDGGSFQLALSGTFSDPDGDTLTYSVSGLPAGLSLDPQTGLISGTLLNNASTLGNNGVYVLTVSASDGQLSASQTVTLTVTNPAPITAGGSFNVAAGTPLSSSLSASDSDGDAFSFDLQQGPNHGSLSLGADGQFIYTPAAGYSGPDSFTYQVRDADGGVTSATVTLAVASDNGSGTGNGGTTPTQPTTPTSPTTPVASTDPTNPFMGLAPGSETQRRGLGLVPENTSSGEPTYQRIVQFEPVLLDAVNSVKRLDGLATLNADRPLAAAIDGIQKLASNDLRTEAAPVAQALGDLNEPNRQPLDVSEMKPDTAAPSRTVDLLPQASSDTDSGPASGEPFAASPATDPGSAIDNVPNAPLTLAEQLQLASQRRVLERDALARLLAG